MRCAVFGCKSDNGDKKSEIRFHCFPKDKKLQKHWINFCRRGDKFNTVTARVCFKHFSPDDYEKNLQYEMGFSSRSSCKLKPGSVPKNFDVSKVEISALRSSRIEGRDTKKMIEDLLKEASKPTPPPPMPSIRLVAIEEIANKKEDTFNRPANFVRQKDWKKSVEENVAQSNSSLSIFGQVKVVAPLNFENKQQKAVKTVRKPSIQISSGLNTLRQTNQRLKLDTAQLLVRVKKAEAIVSNMRKFLSNGQIRRLANPKRRCNWSYEDVANSISLFTTSPVMYQMLWSKNYPMPSPATLKKWVATLKLKPGIITSAIKTLADCSYNERDKLCVLSFYEIRLKAATQFDEPDSGLRPYKFAQVFIARGLVSNWKQIVYYNFDCMMPGLVFKEVVLALRNIGFIVVAGVSGVGPRKLSLWKELKIDEEHPYIEVAEGEKVFFFANVPHLIKRLRNSFIETGFILEDVPINIDPLKEMLQVESSDLWVSHDLNSAHISPKKVGRHNLQVALQLFSKPVADTIRRCVSLGKMNSPHAIECSDFIQTVEEWFKVFNSKTVPQDDSRLSLPYGLALDEQNAALNTMTEIMKILKVREDEEINGMHPFQNGILLNNSSLPQLYEYLQERHEGVCVITNNLNTDDTEHSFAIRKSYGGVAYQPTAIEFKYRLRSGILSNLNVQMESVKS